ncbi:hypothetical protein KW805_02390 [Candidatus Pacearchaeota archaeon]|nr:hypothetical protein [Candidatus Pacearchaeota archaeon]
MMKREAFVVVIMLVLLMPLSSAASVFFDGFESGSLGGWTLTTNNDLAENWTIKQNATESFQGNWYIQSRPSDTLPEPASSIERTISTAGYQNITVSYQRRLLNTDLGDTFQVEWYDGNVWTILETVHGSDLSYIFRTFNLTSLATNNANFKIKFECTAGGVNEMCRVDSVTINGTVIDATPPSITIISPQNNQAFKTSSILFNVTLNENGSVKYTLNNGTTNRTMSSVNNLSFNATNASIADGNYTALFYANDTNGNMNSTSVSFRVDSTPPAFSGVQTNVPSAYSSNLSFFTINWTDASSLQAVLFEANFSGMTFNRTMYRISGNQYGFNMTLPAGILYWRSYANDSLGNMNSTQINTFFIPKAEPILNIVLNGSASNASFPYGTATNVSVFENNSGDSDVSYSFYRDGLLLSGPDIASFGAGNYSYLFNASGGENYTSGSLTGNLTIIQILPSISLLINGADSDSSVALFSIVNISTSLVSPGGAISLYEDGGLRGQGSSFTVTTNYSSTGDRIWNATFAGNQNYSVFSKLHSVSVIDANSPQYSNIKNSPSNPASYSSSLYEFNITWVDDVAISDVIFEFSGKNYSYNAGQINRTGTEYHLIFPSLAAGSYTYKWHANDTANNKVATFSQTYVIDRAIAALFLVMSPGPSVSYGINSSISCLANNLQSAIVLTRDAVWFMSPHSGIFGAGSYNYACTTATSQNYTSASVTGTFSVSKATAPLVLTLNGASSSLTLAPNSLVNISASLVNLNGSISLIENEAIINAGVSQLSNITLYSSAGTFVINVSYDGSENYSASSLSRSITINSPSSGGGSGGGSSGGGGGGGSGGSAGSVAVSTIRQLSLGIEEGYVQPGTSKSILLHAVNTGTRFLNRCTPSVSGELNSSITSGQQKGLTTGEKFDFVLSLQPSETAQPGDYTMQVSITCDEFVQTIPWTLHVFRNSFEASDIAYERQGTALSLNYLLNEFSHRNHAVTANYTVLDSDGLVVVNAQEDISLSSGQSDNRNFLLELPKEVFGEFTLVISLSDGESGSTIRQPIFLPSARITGFALSEGNRKTLGIVGVTLISLLFALIVARFIYSHHKRIQHTHPTRGYIKIQVK